MKKNLIAAAVLLMATVGAFATAKNTVLDPVYYEGPSGCELVEGTKCEFVGTPNCLSDVFIGATQVASQVQIYRDINLTTGDCENAYRP